MGKYDRWRAIFEASPLGEELSLDFSELEAMLGSPLPESAHRHIAWWSPSQPAAIWADYGYRVKVDFRNQRVAFKRVQVTQESSGFRTRSLSSARPDPPQPAANAGDWDRIEEWNAAIEAEFFAGTWQHQPVYLDIEEGTFRKLAQRLDLGVADPAGNLVDTVRSTLHLETDGVSTFSSHLSRTKRWALDGKPGPPPCLALLAVFVIAAEQMRADSDLSAANYRGRLEMLLDLPPEATRSRGKLYRDFTKQSHELWNALNSWIAEGEGHRGIATAKPFDRRVHVGVPISQALIKEADRSRLSLLFTKYRLEPGQNIAPRDMRRLLADWLPNSPLSPYIRFLWSQGSDQKDRIAQIAAIELAAWNGRLPELAGGRESNGSIRLAGRFSRFPTRRLDLWLVTEDRMAGWPGHYVSKGQDGQLQAALGGDGASLEVSAGTSRWAAVNAENDASIGDLMTVMVDLIGPSSARLRRTPRGVVVMGFDPDYGYFVEQERVQLGTDSIVLTFGKLGDDAAQVLASSARPGFSRHNAEALEGLPDAWTAFIDVQLVSIPDTSNPDLAVLVPLAWSEASFGGGYRLPGHQIWHSRRPPEVRLSALDAENAGVELECTQRLGGESSEPIPLGEIDGSGILDLSEALLPDGDYTVRLVKVTVTGEAGSPIISNSFRLRSGRYPRPLDSGSFEYATRPLRERPTWAALSATSDSAGDVSGAQVPAFTSAPSVAGGLLPSHSLPLARREWVPEDDRGPVGRYQHRLSTTVTCAIGSGAHYWILPDYYQPGTHPKEIEGCCRNCGALKWFPKTPPPRTSTFASDGTVPGPASYSSRRVFVEPIPSAAEVDHDLFLDALTYARTGTWESFVKLAGQVDEAPWFAREHSSLLEALGHLEVTRQLADLSPSSWTIAPPTLASTPTADRVIVCGARSDELIAHVNSVASELGGEVTVTPQADGPAIIAIQGFEPDDLSVVAELITDRFGLEVRASINPARSLAHSLPPLREVAETLPRFVPPSVAVQRFNPTANTWDSVADVGRPGAYRFLTRPVLYGTLLEASPISLVRADSRLAKWLASLTTGESLLAYDQAEQQLIVRLGARLPCLYERAAVLCSGQTPTDMKDGTTRYHSVPSEVANRLWNLLT